jgi:hypothetical protein
MTGGDWPRSGFGGFSLHKTSFRPLGWITEKQRKSEGIIYLILSSYRGSAPGLMRNFGQLVDMACEKMSRSGYIWRGLVPSQIKSIRPLDLWRHSGFPEDRQDISTSSNFRPFAELYLARYYAKFFSLSGWCCCHGSRQTCRAAI